MRREDINSLEIAMDIVPCCEVISMTVEFSITQYI